MDRARVSMLAPRGRRLADHPQRRRSVDLPARRPGGGPRAARPAARAVRPPLHRQPGAAEPVQGLGDRVGGGGTGGGRRPGAAGAVRRPRRLGADPSRSRTASSASCRTARTWPRSRPSTRRPTSTSTRRRPRTWRRRSSRPSRPGCRSSRPPSAASPRRSAVWPARPAHGRARTIRSTRRPASSSVPAMRPGWARRRPHLLGDDATRAALAANAAADARARFDVDRQLDATITLVPRDHRRLARRPRLTLSIG